MVKLYAWGTNSHGQLGLGFTSELVSVPHEVCVPAELFRDPREVKISGGGNHTVIYSVNSELYGAGLNDCGQLGCGMPSHNTFTALEAPSTEKVAEVSSGWDFTIFLLTNSTLFGCGSNKFKQLGDSCKEKYVLKPIHIHNFKEIAQASAGLRHVSAISKSGELLLWGDEKHVKFVSGLSQFSKVTSGQKHTVALKDGDIYAWGSNIHGQCGIDPGILKSIPNPIKIEWNSCNGSIRDLCCGWTHTLLLTDKGNVFSWGRNSYGQLGREANCSFLPQRVPELEQIASIACGSEHCMALDAKGQLWTWGWNEHGSCGTGDTANQLRPQNITHHFPGDVISIGCGAGHCFAVVS